MRDKISEGILGLVYDEMFHDGFLFEIVKYIFDFSHLFVVLYLEGFPLFFIFRFCQLFIENAILLTP